MTEQIPAKNLVQYAKHGEGSLRSRIGTTLLVAYVYFYFPFLAVWYLFLRYVVTAYGNALVQGHSLTRAWDYFFSNSPHQTLTESASAFMARCDSIVLIPLSWPMLLVDQVIDPHTMWNGIGLVLIASFFLLIFVAIPLKMFGFFQKLMRNTLDKG